MILYVDSSSLLKLYVQEVGSEATKASVRTADVLASNLIAYAEVRAALAAARRGRRLRSNAEYAQRKADFEEDWSTVFWVVPSEQLIREASELSEAHVLSGFDSIHLASVQSLRSNVSEPVELSTWDRRLIAAARKEGIPLAHEVTS